MTTLDAATVVSIGLLAGALLLETAVLVPHWRSLSVGEFAALHGAFASRLYRFFAPLTVVSVALSVASGVLHLRVDARHAAGAWLTLTGSALAASLMAFYGLYFRTANLRLPEVATAGSQPRFDAMLRRWHRVQQIRTAVSVVALALATLGLAY